MKPFLISLMLVLTGSCLAQDMVGYAELVKQADSLYNSRDYAWSAAQYHVAFALLDGKARPTDRYNAACSYALAGNVDTAFYHLFYLANVSQYANYNHLVSDPDLSSLHADARWSALTSQVRSYKEAAEKDLDKELVAILDTIYQEDQKYRMQLDAIEAKYGRESKEMQAHWSLIAKADSANLSSVKTILDTRGWLGANVIGRQGNSTLFLVIQHADIETQLQYLPMMRDAVKQGNASASDLALLEDRVALRQGNRQIYGSQIGRDPESGEYYVSPLIDPENVDVRRAEVGLRPLAEYVKHWNITWDVEKHKEQTARLEAGKH